MHSCLAQAIADADGLQPRFNLEMNADIEDAKVVLRDAKITFMTGMALEAFRKPVNKSDLRTRVSRATSLFSKGNPKSARLQALATRSTGGVLSQDLGRMGGGVN